MIVPINCGGFMAVDVDSAVIKFRGSHQQLCAVAGLILQTIGYGVPFSEIHTTPEPRYTIQIDVSVRGIESLVVVLSLLFALTAKSLDVRCGFSVSGGW